VAAPSVCPRPTILIVESTSVRNLIGAVLERQSYALLLQDTAGGLEVLGRQPVDLLITNEPWEFKAFLSHTRVLYISGAPDREFLHSHRSARFAYLQKPFRHQALIESVRGLLHDMDAATLNR
jgi:DNA-binding NtrC family response regulator